MHGLLLAAGAGTRMGRPKALMHGPDGSAWLHRGVQVLSGGGCAAVTVVLGAAADEARELLGSGPAGIPVQVVVADDWAAGMSASLGSGLAALADVRVEAVAVTLVDLPDLSAEVVRRVVTGRDQPTALARATYHGRLGHPVVLGRDHWPGILTSTEGDRGARDYLAAHGAELVECGDLATGRDVDHPAD